MIMMMIMVLMPAIATMMILLQDDDYYHDHHDVSHQDDPYVNHDIYDDDYDRNDQLMIILPKTSTLCDLPHSSLWCSNFTGVTMELGGHEIYSK